jgi:molybdopterin-guanine dinucleotide biosynthesis protein A
MKVSAIYISTGHNFFGHHGQPAGTHPAQSVDRVECVTGRGLRGDRFFDYKKGYSGQVSFFDEEVHRSLLRAVKPPPCSIAAYRRNVVVRATHLPALIGREFSVQGVRFLGVGEAKPCYWMDHAVAAGAEQFLRGNGGLRAKVLSDGILKVDSPTETALLLAGGRSRRMGSDKTLLTWGDTTLGQHQAATLAASGAWPLLFSCRADQTWTPEGFQRVEDVGLDQGVVGALVEAWRVTNAHVMTVLAVDVPYVTPELLNRWSGVARDGEISVVPKRGEHFEPLVAAWHRSARDELEAALVAGASLQHVCAQLQQQGRLVEAELTAAEASLLANLNTPEDVRRLTRPVAGLA